MEAADRVLVQRGHVVRRRQHGVLGHPDRRRSATVWETMPHPDGLLEEPRRDRAERDPGRGLPRRGPLEHRPRVVEAVLAHPDQVGVPGPRPGQRGVARPLELRRVVHRVRGHDVDPLGPLGVGDLEGDRPALGHAVAHAARGSAARPPRSSSGPRGRSRADAGPAPRARRPRRPAPRPAGPRGCRPARGRATRPRSTSAAQCPPVRRIFTGRPAVDPVSAAVPASLHALRTHLGPRPTIERGPRCRAGAVRSPARTGSARRYPASAAAVRCRPCSAGAVGSGASAASSRST